MTTGFWPEQLGRWWFLWDGRAWRRLNKLLNLEKSRHWVNYNFSTDIWKVIWKEFDLFHVILRNLMRDSSWNIWETFHFSLWSAQVKLPARKWWGSPELLRLRQGDHLLVGWSCNLLSRSGHFWEWDGVLLIMLDNKCKSGLPWSREDQCLSCLTRSS